MLSLHRTWTQMSLRGQLAALLVATVVVFEIVTTLVEYRVLHIRAVDRGRATAVDFAMTVYPLLASASPNDQDAIAARLISPHRSVGIGSGPDGTTHRLDQQAAAMQAELRADGHALADVIILERPSGIPDPQSDGQLSGRATEIDVYMQPAGRSDWIVARTLSIPKPATLPLLVTASIESFASLVVMFGMLAVVGHLVGPLGRLAQSAARISHGERVDALPLEGSADMRDTVQAFNQMTSSISQTIAYQRSLLQSLGHDLKAPLATARAQIVAATDPEARERIEVSLDRVENTLRSITDFTRATMRDGAVEQVDLVSLLEALIEEAQDRGHFVTAELNGDLVVPARYHAIERALRNLVENAAIHGSSAHIAISATDGFATIIIDDTGDGIDEAMLDTVFEPFSRLSDDPRGSGLGLAIARTIILDHGGELTLRNRADGGLRQTVTLPL